MTPVVGVLGGMGPAATADFYAQLIRATPAERDQDHLRVVIWADPTVPDRIASVFGQGADAYPALLAGVRRLAELGATIAAMPCNTAHFYLDRLVADSGLPFVDMVAETVSSVVATHAPTARVGLLGTRATLRTRLYQDRFAAAGLSTVLPAPETQVAAEDAIRQVKTGATAAARAPAESAVRDLTAAGADVVVLACTELPLALRANDGDAPLVDPTVELARAVVRECVSR